MIGVGEVQGVGLDGFGPVICTENQGEARVFEADAGAAESAEDVGVGDAGRQAGGLPVAVCGGQGGFDLSDVFGGQLGRVQLRRAGGGRTGHGVFPFLPVAYSLPKVVGYRQPFLMLDFTRKSPNTVVVEADWRRCRVR